VCEVAPFDEPSLLQAVEHAVLPLLDFSHAIQLNQADAPRLRQRPAIRRRLGRVDGRGFLVHAGLVDDDARASQRIRRHRPRFFQPLQHGRVDGEKRWHEIEYVADRNLCDISAFENVGGEESTLAADLVEVGAGVEQRAAIRLAGQDGEHRKTGSPGNRDHRVDARNHRVVAAHPDGLRIPGDERVDRVADRRRVVGVRLEQRQPHALGDLSSALDEDQRVGFRRIPGGADAL
jgi:hypothetical protein